MTVGSDDYLVDSIRREFADAVVDDFGELSKVLLEWQQTALRRADKVSTDEEEIDAGAETVAAVHVASEKPREADSNGNGHKGEVLHVLRRQATNGSQVLLILRRETA